MFYPTHKHHSSFGHVAAALLAVLMIGGLWAAEVSPTLLSGLHWREIGPARFSSRVDDVAGVPGNPNILYSANSTGGLWRSTNGGTTFESVFNDGGTLSVGAVAISPDNPNVVYIGTGEGFPRNSISFGDGLYKSVDGGNTWKDMGLKDTRRFSRIVVNPQNPQIVFAAAMGHAFGPNKERGIFRSQDAGQTWKQVLYVNDLTGASDVAIDPKDPNIVYAGMYQYIRKPYTFIGGGPGSGMYRSSDGGDHWTKLTDPSLHNGLPGAKLIGRVGISICYSNPNVVYTLIETQEPGVLWRSSDRGIHWTLVNSSHNINNRPFYYTQVRVDPNDENHLFTLAGSFSESNDGGKSFHGIPGASMFGDHHALWIDPTNSMRMLSGTDGGFFISNDGARHWDFRNNMPVAQPYHVGVDMADPYNVMGGFQDHEIWIGPSTKWNEVGVMSGDWYRLRNMADGQYALADPRDPAILYYDGHFGDITRLDRRNREWPGRVGRPARTAVAAIPIAGRHHADFVPFRTRTDPDLVILESAVYGSAISTPSDRAGQPACCLRKSQCRAPSLEIKTAVGSESMSHRVRRIDPESVVIAKHAGAGMPWKDLPPLVRLAKGTGGDVV